MYQPISFNVLRQRLSKMGLPKAEMRVLSGYCLPDGTQTAEYLLSFTEAAIREWLLRHGWHMDLRGYAHFKFMVIQSFANDITVLDEYDNSRPGYLGLVGHVRVPPRPVQASLFD